MMGPSKVLLVLVLLLCVSLDDCKEGEDGRRLHPYRFERPTFGPRLRPRTRPPSPQLDRVGRKGEMANHKATDGEDGFNNKLDFGFTSGGVDQYTERQDASLLTESAPKYDDYYVNQDYDEYYDYFAANESAPSATTTTTTTTTTFRPRLMREKPRGSAGRRRRKQKPQRRRRRKQQQQQQPDRRRRRQQNRRQQEDGFLDTPRSFSERRETSVAFGDYSSKRGEVGDYEEEYDGDDQAAAEGHAQRRDDRDYYEDDDYYDERGEDSRRQGQAGSSGYGGGGGGVSALALLVAPLAGIALLSAAAAVALNPVLVNISTTNGRRRRRKRSESSNAVVNESMKEKFREFKTLDSYLHGLPEGEDAGYQQRLLWQYLSCSGLSAAANLCLDRIVCQYSCPAKHSQMAQRDRDVVAIILHQIMSNPYVGKPYKSRLRSAAKLGRRSPPGTQCDQVCRDSFSCAQLDEPTEAPMME